MIESASISRDAAKARANHYFTHVCSRCGAEAFSYTTIQPIGWEMRGMSLNEPLCPDCAGYDRSVFPVRGASEVGASPPLVLVGDSGGPDRGKHSPVDTTDSFSADPHVRAKPANSAPKFHKAPASITPMAVVAVRTRKGWMIAVQHNSEVIQIPIDDFRALATSGLQLADCMERDWHE